MGATLGHAIAANPQALRLFFRTFPALINGPLKTPDPLFEYMMRAVDADGTVLDESTTRRWTSPWAAQMVTALLAPQHPGCWVEHLRRAAGSNDAWEPFEPSPASWESEEGETASG